MAKPRKFSRRPIAKGKHSLCLVIGEGIRDEKGGNAYYRGLLRKLRAAGASKSTIDAFKASRKDELKHKRKLVHLRVKVCR